MNNESESKFQNLKESMSEHSEQNRLNSCKRSARFEGLFSQKINPQMKGSGSNLSSQRDMMSPTFTIAENKTGKLPTQFRMLGRPSNPSIAINQDCTFAFKKKTTVAFNNFNDYSNYMNNWMPGSDTDE